MPQIEIFCMKCQPDKEGNRVKLKYKETIKVNKDKAVDYYECPTEDCGEKRGVVFENGMLIGVR
jgi:hypothetical protein